MMKRYIKIFAILIFLNINHMAQAFDDQSTHPEITKKAADNSSIKTYLNSNLGDMFSKGLDSVVNGKSVLSRLQEGSTDEDSPMCRASNHFHNPLKSWDKSYMSDDTTILGSLVRTYCNLAGWSYSDRKSNVTWATGYLSRNGSKASISKQEYDWDDARIYYYQALTGSSSTDRETYFARTFQTLGQVIHLLEDMAVPAHTRNDFTSHLAWSGIDSFVPTDWFGNPFEEYVKNNPGILWSISSEPSSFSLLTDFWDTDQYTGSNPSNSLSIGLSEFTNANYFSDYTIPNNSPTSQHIFNYPYVNTSSYQICEDYASGSNDIRRYISRKNKGGCPSPSEARTADHFATPSLLNEESEITDNNISAIKLWLDDNVHNTYAKELLPRAVGYSAGLLNYFFRGSIDMIKDPNNSSQYVIKNESDEDMDGTFTLCYDDANENRKCFANWGLQIGAGGSKSVSFTAPTSPEPKEKGKYILIFQGTLGSESGAVVGKTVKLCGGSATITISGSDAPQNGSQYTATGGEKQYTWSITKGAITPDSSDSSKATVSSITNQCGAVTITATDSCGNKTTKDVRMPKGSWHYVSGNYWAYGSKCKSETSSGIFGTTDYYSCVNYKTEYFTFWPPTDNSTCTNISSTQYNELSCPEGGCTNFTVSGGSMDENGDISGCVCNKCIPVGPCTLYFSTPDGLRYYLKRYYKWYKIWTKNFEWRCQ